MQTIDYLLEATAGIWAKYNEHPFVLGIQNGTLDKDKFRYYIIQDYLYLEEYAKTFAIGAAKAKSQETLQIFTNYIQALTGGEMDIHKGYMGKFGVAQEELDNTPRALDNLSYTSYMLRIAYEEGEVEILAAILSCAYSYEVIAKKMVENHPEATDDAFYGEWVQGYVSDEYAEENKVLMDVFNRLTKDLSKAQLEHLKDIFVACSRYELNFWEMGWTLAK